MTFNYPEKNRTSSGSNEGHPLFICTHIWSCLPFYFFFPLFSLIVRGFVSTSKFNWRLPHANHSAIASLISTITSQSWSIVDNGPTKTHVGYSIHFHHTSGGARREGHWERSELWDNPIAEITQPPAKTLPQGGGGSSLTIAQRPWIKGVGDLVLLTEGNIMKSPPSI